MADQFLTLVQLQDLFFGVAVSITGLNASNVRHAYQPNGQPAWQIGENMLSLFISAVDDPYDKQRDITYAAGVDSAHTVESVGYTTVLALDCYFFGPLAFDYARKMKSGILKPAARDVLAASQVYPITEIQAPQHVPYLFEGQWWERVDLRIVFNAANVEQSTLATLAVANIELVTESGVDRTIHITN